uniref:2OG-Fe(II) oxygenase superfamily protein n=1 Tax=Marseillevirus LCMAC103 TaxID=2506604 RepID=A0A481YVT9_9VIRU|nr:MAG: 2OG-Fe(II) oxygenase superfamily protein [Marseillevirus LCMAC103]
MATPEGLCVVPDFLTAAEAQGLLGCVEASDEWYPVVPGSAKSRRVLHFGWSYPYAGGALQAARPIPASLRLGAKFARLPAGAAGFAPDQLIVNRYEPGQGIAPHVDRTDLFGPVIACVTLGSGAEMEFTRPGYPSFRVYTTPGSLYAMTGEARYLWQHRMRSRLTDPEGGKRVPRGVRVSLTYRTKLG